MPLDLPGHTDTGITAWKPTGLTARLPECKEECLLCCRTRRFGDGTFVAWRVEMAWLSPTGRVVRFLGAEE